MDKKSAFSLLDWEFQTYPSNFLCPLGWFSLTAIGEALMHFAHCDDEDADEWAYEWANQPMYKKYLEPM
jgi:hypothetical protein